MQEGFIKTDEDLRTEAGMLECQKIRREVARSKQQGSDDEDDDVRSFPYGIKFLLVLLLSSLQIPYFFLCGHVSKPGEFRVRFSASSFSLRFLNVYICSLLSFASVAQSLARLMT